MKKGFTLVEWMISVAIIGLLAAISVPSFIAAKKTAEKNLIINQMDKKQSFYKVYANLPLDLRQEIILVLENEPISWAVAKLEIDNETTLGKQILEKLESLEVI